MRDVNAQITERINEKIEKVLCKLENLPSEAELTLEIEEVTSSLSQIESGLDFASISAPGEADDSQAVLEMQREKLRAQLERLELRKELMTERREQLKSILGELRESLTRREFFHSSFYEPPAPHSEPRRPQEERRKILEMVQSGKITTDEAARLLDALRDQEKSVERRRRKPRWVRIRVTDRASNRVRVNLTLPVGVVRAGLRAGEGLIGIDTLDIGGLEEMLNRGETGHILDTYGEDDSEHIEIFIE